MKHTALFHVVLFEPEIPPNTGNVIRLCANTGAALHLIKPLGFRLDDKSLKRSGLDYHDMAAVSVHENLEDCLRGLPEARVFAVETVAPQRYSDVSLCAGDAFLFGSETRGLPAWVLERLGRQRCLSIPMRPDCRSLNLSNAVAVTIFEAWRQLGFQGCALEHNPGVTGGSFDIGLHEK
jgi:tRNA (cytidine/uridine-2'-O-)-methyltransferase